MWKKIILGGVLSLIPAVHAEKATVGFDRADGVYHSGDSVQITATIPPSAAFKRYDLIVGSDRMAWPGKPVAFKIRRDAPAFHRVLIQGVTPEGKYRDLASSRFWINPEKFAPAAAAEPADFMTFWRKQLAESEKMPLDSKRERLEKYSKPGKYTVYKISLNAPLGRIYGFLSIPDKKGKLPALMTVCYAGSGWTAPNAFSESRVILSMNIHNFDPFQRDAEYAKLCAPHQKQYKARDSYMYIGIPDPEKMYYLHGIVGTCRALDYLASLPEVDPKRIGYYGTSQGGAFGLYLGALSDKLSAIVCDVPAICDLNGDLAGRYTGFPWYGSRAGKTPEIRKCISYYDGANFAACIKTPIRVICGVKDETCYPYNIRTAFNRIPASDKQFFTDYNRGHGNSGKIYGQQLQWLYSKIEGNKK